VDLLWWYFSIYCEELHGLEAKPDVLIGITGMFGLQITFCFFLLVGLLDCQLSMFVVCGGAGVSHILIMVLYSQVYIIAQSE
jgi:hypothetical protein